MKDETLRVSGKKPLRRGGGTGGHQLWPQVFPRAGVSLAEEHNLTTHI